MQRALVRKMLKRIRPQMDGNAAATLFVLAHPHGHRFAKTQQHLIGILFRHHIPGRGNGVAVALILRRHRHHRFRIPAVGKVPNGLAVLAKSLFENVYIRFRKITDGVDAQ